MNRTATITGVLLALMSAACSGRTLEDEESSDSATVPRAQTVCQEWCETAVECSTIYAQEWSFSTTAECEEVCLGYHDGLSELSDGACDEPLLDFHECATPLTCEQFSDMERDYWQIEDSAELPCQAEYMAFLSVGLCT